MTAKKDFETKEVAAKFIRAVKQSDAAGARSCIEHGTDLEAPLNDGSAPVHIAAKNGHVQIMELLAESGAELNKTDSQGNTAAHIAAKNGHADVLQLLYDKKANFVVVNKNGDTPLGVAKQAKQAAAVKLLTEVGAPETRKQVEALKEYQRTSSPKIPLSSLTVLSLKGPK